MGLVSFAEETKTYEANVDTPDDQQEAPVNVYKYQETPENKSWASALPLKQGLYDPALEKDACGVGFAA